MKVLVTGAGGFLGKALIERLLVHGFTEIRCNIRRRNAIPGLDAIRARYAHANLEYFVGNLRYPEDAARAVEGVQLVFHLAAGMKGAPADMLMDSVVASRNLLDAIAQRPPLRIVLVSSLAVYGVATLSHREVVNEQTPLESHPQWRDPYSHFKLLQEQLFWKYQRRNHSELVVLRPGVVYGPGGSHFSDRVGLTINGWHLHLGGNNPLPLTHVDNCAEAIVVAGTHKSASGQAFNVIDDGAPTCREYLSLYKRLVKPVRSISIPYIGLKLLAHALTKYHQHSKGQIPSIFTPYRVASMWRRTRFDNSRLHSIGWKQILSTAEGLRQSFSAFRNDVLTHKKADTLAKSPAIEMPLQPAKLSPGQGAFDSTGIVQDHSLTTPAIDSQDRCSLVSAFDRRQA